MPDVVISIGPITSATAIDRGLTIAAEADPHTVDGLVDAMVLALPQLGAGRPDSVL